MKIDLNHDVLPQPLAAIGDVLLHVETKCPFLVTGFTTGITTGSEEIDVLRISDVTSMAVHVEEVGTHYVNVGRIMSITTERK